MGGNLPLARNTEPNRWGSFAANAGRIQIPAAADNLDNFLLSLATPGPFKEWSLISPAEKLIKIGAKVGSKGLK
jgi:hypothetical protein